MKRILLTLAIITGITSTGTAFASDDKCSVPMSDWQPREALRQKLEADGWKVNRIKVDDGCYEAYAINKEGQRIEAYFDPKTFKIVKMKVED